MTRYHYLQIGGSKTFHPQPASRKLFNYRYHNVSKSIDDIRTSKSMGELPPLTKDATNKPKVVLFYKNGDRNFRGHHLTVTPRRFRNFDGLLSELTRVTNLAQGARYVFTPTTGTRITSLEELVDGRAYVCGSYPKLKKINYDHAPDGSSRQKLSEKNFIPVTNSNNKMKVETPSTTSSDKLPPNVKPRIVTIVRNSVTRPKKSVKILLNRRTAQTYEQVLNDITQAAGVDGGCVRKLYSIEGRLVKSLTELFVDPFLFIAVGNERFRSTDLPQIIQDFGVKKSISSKNSSSTSDISSNSRKSFNSKQKDTNGEGVTKTPVPVSKKLPDIKKTHKESIDEHVVATFNNSDSIEHVVLEDNDFDLPSTNSVHNSSPASLNRRTPLPSIRSDSSVTKTFDGGPEIENELEKVMNGITNEDKKTWVLSDDNSSSDKTNEIVENHSSSSSETQKLNGTIENLKLGENPDDDDHSSSVQDSSGSRSSSSTSTASSSSTLNGDPQTTNGVKESSNLSSSNLSQSHSSDSKQTSDAQPPHVQNSTVTSKKYHDYKLDISDEIQNFFDVGEELGDGNFAVVKTALDKHSGRMYAMKIIDASKIKGKEEMIRNEIYIQRESIHPNIVHLVHDLHSPTEIFLIMELITGGDLFDLIAENIKFEEDEASLYTRDLCSGLDYLHKRTIVHRDIKPENLMVCVSSDGLTSLKITDFGLAQKVTKPIFTICGTPTYVSPEILKEKGYGLEVDVWAAGVIMYIMLCGFPPFRSPNRRQSELFDMIETGVFEFLEPYWDDVSDSAKDLISNVLVVDTSQRFKCKDVLTHEWLTQYGLTRNDTMMEATPRTSRFKVVGKTVQGVERMKNMAGVKLERGENFLGSLTSENTGNT